MLLCSYINAYNSKLQNSLDKIAPVTKKEVNSRPNQPWLNAELRTLKRKKCQIKEITKKIKMIVTTRSIESRNQYTTQI